MKRNTMSFKAIINNIARENKVSAQSVLQTYMLEKLLERISVSKYKDNFILKGGMLISAMLGIDSRTTMDMDTTIKGFSLTEENINNIMNETKKKFEKCFFMFSSLKTQSSYVMEDNEMSYFTNSLVEALKNYNNQEYVKYSEILNYMADYFKNIGKQTPFFVTQTDMLDKFIDYNEEVVNFLQNINKQEIEKNKDTNETLKTQIEKKLELCATKDEAKELIDTIIDNFNFFSIDDKIINEYFEVKKEIDINLIELPNKKNIANWIYENKSELNLFAKTKLEELHKSKFYSIINLSETLYGNDKESNYEFEIMEKDFLNNIRITFTPKSLGLEKYEMDIVIVPSFSKLYVFLTFINNIPITWGDFQYDYMNEWSMKEFNIKSEINVEKFVKETYENFIKFCMDNLENMLGK